MRVAELERGRLSSKEAAAGQRQATAVLLGVQHLKHVYNKVGLWCEQEKASE